MLMPARKMCVEIYGLRGHDGGLDLLECGNVCSDQYLAE